VISGQSGRGPYQQRLEVAPAATQAGNQALRYLWARSRIASLSDYGQANSATEHKDAIVALGLKYNLLTPFTSFIAVLEVVRNHQGAATDVKQPLPLPEGVSNLAVGGGMTGHPEPELVVLFCAVGLLLLVVWRARVRRARQRG
jgi:Ca-activated chloride channel family protein